MKNLYHLIDYNSLNQLRSNPSYEPESLQQEGFVHLAYDHQLPFIINHFFKGASGIHLLEIAPSLLHAEVVDEAPAGIEDDGELYPHLYGALNASAVQRLYALSIDGEGGFTKTEVPFHL
ncbi:DUF952 domain-containing protein [Photobacterium proteolyticum]|uniref:DUF952 domain-containing protein n=1 Tax=Photobacterium proteolyticum TaxID=1903952 RepID=UPI000952ECA2|nr:DUF952 domain-containing protein [Photobacterium proteolyticum]